MILKRGTLLGNIGEPEETCLNTNKIASVTVSECTPNQIGDIGAEHDKKLDEMLSEYKMAVKSKCKEIPIEHYIDLKDDIPVSQQPRRVQYGLEQPIKEHIESLLKSGRIEQSTSRYGSPIIPIIKKNGEIRIAIDYRSLNKKTIPRRFPIPHQDELIQKVKGSSIFSVLDLKHGYYNIPVAKSDKKKTAFIVPWGKYEWAYLPLGLVGAPFTFGEAMAYVFKDFDFVAVYFDDILIFSKSIDEHFSHLQKVLERLAEYGFEINDLKSQLFFEEVLFLGYRVSGTGIQVDVKKIRRCKF